MAALSDEALMSAYAGGDLAAFDQLYGRHRVALFSFLLRGLGDRSRAEDSFQQVWCKLIDARARYRPEASFAGYLYTIANRVIVDDRRRQRPFAALGPEVEASMADMASLDPASAAALQQRQTQLAAALSTLPAEQRVVVLLRLQQSLSLDAIAQIVKAPRETVKSRLRYAIAKLKDLLQ